MGEGKGKTQGKKGRGKSRTKSGKVAGSVEGDAGAGASEQIGVTVVLPNGSTVAELTRPADSTVAELKFEVSRLQGTAAVLKERAPDFLMLLHTVPDSLHPSVLENSASLQDSGVRANAQIVLVHMPFCAECDGKCREPASHEQQQLVPWTEAGRCERGAKTLPDLSRVLIQNGDYDKYLAWREEYRSWREGLPRGAQGWVAAEAAESEASDSDNAAFRDGYRKWRLGRPRGAAGEAAAATAEPLAKLRREVARDLQEGGHACLADSEQVRKIDSAPAVIFDVVAESPELPSLIPVDGPPVAPIPIDDFPPEALVTIRVFRFFEDRGDERQVWEQELKNVNSGSLLWLPVHLAPGMHSKSGAKYGSWFTIHYLQVYAKHFRSAYHMANEGTCYPAKTFGATKAETSTVSGNTLTKGYFWYVSPATQQPDGQLGPGNEGWQHLCRAGPYDGNAFLEQWRKSGSPLEGRALQEVLALACQQ